MAFFNTRRGIFIGWISAWIVSSLCFVGLDCFLGASNDGELAFVAACGLAVVFGTSVGLVTAVISDVSCRLPRSLLPLPWILAWGLGFAWLADSLGAVSRIGGRHHGFAVAALVGCGVATLALSGVAIALQPKTKQDRDWLSGRAAVVRWSFAIIILVAVGVIVMADARVLPSLYPDAHLAMRLSSMYLVAAVVYSSGATLFPERVTWSVGIVVALIALAASPFAILDDERLEVASTVAKRPFRGTMLTAIRGTIDVDRDGFSALLAGGDCAPLDPAINPTAAEIPGNDVDENCMDGDGKVSLTDTDVARSPPVPTAPAPLSVVLITVDALRADRMSAYGAERATTPNIARWAEDAVRFDSAITSGLWTTIALPSLLYGVYPRRLRWNLLYKTSRGTLRPQHNKLRRGERVKSKFVLPLDEPRMTLPELLTRRGMHTIAVVDDGFTDILRPEWGFGRGFDDYVRVKSLPRSIRNDEGTATLAIERLKERPLSQRFFMWVHFFGPHLPDRQHEGLPKFGTRAEDKYDHEVAFVDREVGRLLGAIDALEEPVAVILTSDHGEYIYPGGNGRSHGTNATMGNVSIPLLLRAPSLNSGTSTSVVSTVDIAPTVLGMTETPAPAGLDGIDLRTVLDRPADFADRVVFSDSFILNQTGAERFRFDLVAAIGSGHKLIDRRVKRSREFAERGDHEVTSDASDERRLLEQSLSLYLESTGGTPQIRP